MARAKVRFDEADREVYDLMESVIQERFSSEFEELAKPLQIKILMASNGGRVFEPCLKHHGAAAVALIRKSKEQERALDGPDLYIEIDSNRWAERKERGRCAILAHELRHIGFARESEKKGGGIKYDAYDRPVVKFWKDDWVLTGFHDVVAWYGEDAVEYQAVRRIQEQLVQLGLPFSEEEDRVVEQAGRIVDNLADSEAQMGTESIEFSSNDGKSVTLTAEHFSAVGKAAKKLRGKASEPAVAAAV